MGNPDLLFDPTTATFMLAITMNKPEKEGDQPTFLTETEPEIDLPGMDDSAWGEFFKENNMVPKLGTLRMVFSSLKGLEFQDLGGYSDAQIKDLRNIFMPMMVEMCKLIVTSGDFLPTVEQVYEAAALMIDHACCECQQQRTPQLTKPGFVRVISCNRELITEYNMTKKGYGQIGRNGQVYFIRIEDGSVIYAVEAFRTNEHFKTFFNSMLAEVMNTAIANIETNSITFYCDRLRQAAVELNQLADQYEQGFTLPRYVEETNKS